MESNVRSSTLTLVLTIASACLVASMGLYAVGLGDWMFTALLAWPGAFLVQSFGVLSLYVPFLFGVLAWMSSSPVLKPSLLVPLGISVLPFLTLSALFQTLDPTSTSPVAAVMARTMGAAAPVFLGLLTVLEILLGAVATLTVSKSLTTDEESAKIDPDAVFDTTTIPPVRSRPRPEAEIPPTPQPVREPESAKGESTYGTLQTAEPTPAQDDVLRVPHIKGWDTARALRDDPYFVEPIEAPYQSAALDALNETLSDEWFDDSPDEAESLARIFEPETEAGTETEIDPADAEIDEYADEVPVVDWDQLAVRTSIHEAEILHPVEEEEEDDDFDEELELTDQAAVEEAIQVLAQPSALIRPLEGGNFPVKTIHVLPEAPRAAPEPGFLAKAEAAQHDIQGSIEAAGFDRAEPTGSAGHWAQRPKFKNWHIPVEGILTAYKEGNFGEIDEGTKRAGHILKMTLKEFNIEADVTGIRKGPVVTMFEILPAAGVKLSKIVALADNIALGLAATSIRIVAPIPGKHAVGIEVPNKERTIVGFAEMINSREFQESKAEIPMVLGKDISGDTQIIDLTRTPHLLIAGATGAGKSVCVNTLVCSILYRRSPDDVKLLMVDPKIVELKFFNDIPHLLAPVITDPKKALQAVQWCLYEMERRYALLDAIGAKDIRSYNSKIDKRHIATNKLPYIVLVIDEFADLMATSGKDLEGTIARLAAMSRAIGIHLVLATQRPSVDVITGLIKANFPSRVAFMVASKTDSRIIIDQMGAEKLLGRGDMLFTSSWNPFPNRVQGAFLSEDDVERVVAHVKTLGEPDYISDEIFFDEEEEDALDHETSGDEMDPLFEKGVEIVRTFKKASASFLQRRLGVGYNRAARMIELMEEMGIVGPQNGSKPREIVHS